MNKIAWKLDRSSSNFSLHEIEIFSIFVHAFIDIRRTLAFLKFNYIIRLSLYVYVTVLLQFASFVPLVLSER